MTKQEFRSTGEHGDQKRIVREQVQRPPRLLLEAVGDGPNRNVETVTKNTTLATVGARSRTDRERLRAAIENND